MARSKKFTLVLDRSLGTPFPNKDVGVFSLLNPSENSFVAIATERARLWLLSYVRPTVPTTIPVWYTIKNSRGVVYSGSVSITINPR